MNIFFSHPHDPGACLNAFALAMTEKGDETNGRVLVEHPGRANDESWTPQDGATGGSHRAPQ